MSYSTLQADGGMRTRSTATSRPFPPKLFGILERFRHLAFDARATDGGEMVETI